MSDRILAAVMEAPHHQRGRALPAPHGTCAACRSGMLKAGAIGSQRYGLHSLDEPLADAAAMRSTKALVDPWLS